MQERELFCSEENENNEFKAMKVMANSEENENQKSSLAEAMVGLMNLLIEKEILLKIIIKHISYDDVEGKGLFIVSMKDDSEIQEINEIIDNSQELKILKSFGKINFDLDETQMVLKINFQKNKK